MYFKYEARAIQSAEIREINVSDTHLNLEPCLSIEYTDADRALAAFDRVMEQIQYKKVVVDVPTDDEAKEIVTKLEHEKKVKAAALDFLSGKSDPIKNKEFEIHEVLTAAIVDLHHCSLSNFEEDLVKRISKTAKDAGEFLQALYDSRTPEGNKLVKNLGEYFDKFTSHKDTEAKEAKKVET